MEIDLKINTTTVAGEADSLEDTMICEKRYVGLLVEYNEREDTTTITYCSKEALTEYYYQSLDLTAKGMYTREPDGGNWSNAYERLCETTCDLLLGTYDGWCMDLARFYSDLLVNKPTNVLLSMFHNGLELEDAVSGDTWCDGIVNSKDAFIQIDYNHEIDEYDTDNIRFNISAYKYKTYGSNTTDNTDFSDTIYYAVVTEKFIRSIHSVFEKMPKLETNTIPKWRADPIQLSSDMLIHAFNKGFVSETDDTWFNYTADEDTTLYVHIHRDSIDDEFKIQAYTGRHERACEIIYSNKVFEHVFIDEDIIYHFEEYNNKKIPNSKDELSEDFLCKGSTREIPTTLYDKLDELGLLPTDINSTNVGESNYATHFIQPWAIFNDYDLNYQEGDIIKRMLRTKEGDSRLKDLQKCQHILAELIRQEEYKERRRRDEIWSYSRS